MRSFKVILLFVAVLFGCIGALLASEIKRDENVIFFPSYAVRVNDREWRVNVHGWVFEWERRPGVASAFRKTLGIDPDTLSDLEGNLFSTRTRLFLIDAERGKKVSIHLGGRIYDLPPSDSTGHFRGAITVPEQELIRTADDTISFQAITASNDSRVIVGRAKLIEPQGLSIISDIDDTIKISEVLERKQLLRNTFLKEFTVVPEMASVYRAWSTNYDAAFHYLSASPSQLLPALEEFRQTNGFPAGTFHLRALDWRVGLQHGSGAKRHKPSVLKELLTDFPKRQFVLVGDSGEKDPEIYGEVARQFSGQVVKILIRNVTGEDRNSPRYKEAFRGVDPALWMIFDDASPLHRLTFKGQRPDNR